jgi:hypothetical protein
MQSADRGGAVRQDPEDLRVRSWTSTWLFLVLFSSPTQGWAFNSYPVGSHHDQITKAAAVRSGFSAEATRALQKAVRAPDWNETRKWLPLRPNEKYRPEHHFDRPFGVSTSEAFRNGSAYVRVQLGVAVDCVRSDDQRGAIDALGRVLHAVQDFSSHSNLVLLSEDERQQCENALWNGGDPPNSLMLTGYDATADDPERPRGDEYSHAEHAKDSPGKNDESSMTTSGGSTVFELAFANAVERTVVTLDRFFELVPDRRRTITEYRKGAFSLIHVAPVGGYLSYSSAADLDDATVVGGGVSCALIAPVLYSELGVSFTIGRRGSEQALVDVLLTGFPLVEYDRPVRPLIGLGVGAHPSEAGSGGLRNSELVLLTALGLQAMVACRAAARVSATGALLSSAGDHLTVSMTFLFAL